MSSSRVQDRGIAREIARQLAPEFAGFFSQETIERSAAEGYAYYSSLVADGGMAPYLPALTERFVRNRLTFFRTDRLAFAGTPEVLFVCVRNAGRSQIAAALLDHYGRGRVRARSAGSRPAAEVQPEVLTALRDMGIDTTGRFPKRLTGEAVASADLIITLGCGDACPVVAGKHYLDWPVPDPHGRSLTAVRVLVGHLADRVRALLAELPAPLDGPDGLAATS